MDNKGQRRWLSILGLILGIIIYSRIIYPTIIDYYSDTVFNILLIVGIVLRVELDKTIFRGMMLWFALGYGISYFFMS